MSDSHHEWEVTVGRADGLLFAGADPEAAVSIYRTALDQLPHESNFASHQWAAAVVIAHRIGLAEQFIGQTEEAEAAFNQLDEILSEVRESEVSDSVVEYVDALRRYSADQRSEVGLRLEQDDSFGPTQMAMPSVLCWKHGCPWFASDCGFDEKHC